MRVIFRSMLSLVLCVLLPAHSAAAQTPNVERASSPKPIKVKRGSELSLVLAETVSSATAKKGQTVRMELDRDWKVDDRVILPKGARAKGVVTHSEHAIPRQKDGYVRVKPVLIELQGVGTLRLSDNLLGEDDCGDMGPCWALYTVGYTVLLPLTLAGSIERKRHQKQHHEAGKDEVLPVGDKVQTYTARTIVLPAR